MGISTRGVYGLGALYYILLNSHTNAVQASEIARAIDVPQNYLEQLLFVLRNKGYLTSTRGPKGGYKLAEGTENVPIRDFLDVLEGAWIKKIQTQSPALNLFWADSQEKIRTIYGTTLKDLIRYEEKISNQNMYYI
ncbi:MAG: Rrf2 family transcriptional regulator [Helicobacter sp.]|nr:Rrf2 family transcriptional regulator [Helicobacter sp.]MDE6045651.1 Rrf2 family transcriptional regulator [Helicobacter sp.]MDE7195875.1 Rrf2 family transcriptional regulator [Helicobacter sp.]